MRISDWSSDVCSSDLFGRGETPREQPDRGAFDIAFAAGNLAGEADIRACLEPQRGIEQFGRANEGVAVEPAQPREFGILEPWNGEEHPHLLGVLALGLEADDGPERGSGLWNGRGQCRERVCKYVVRWVGSVS